MLAGDGDLNVAHWLLKRGHPLSYGLGLDPYEKLIIMGMMDLENDMEGG